jgi:phosphatidate phosphatase APP1
MIFRIITLPFRFAFTRFRKSLGKLGTIRVEPLYAFGNEYKVMVKARVVESFKQSVPQQGKSYLQNLLATLRRYAGNSIPGSKVEISFHGQNKIVESDEEGIVDCSFDMEYDPVKGPDAIEFRLIPEEGIIPEKEIRRGMVQRYPALHPLGVISDIDDTILISHATQVGRKFWLSISKNAYTRRPFPGVSKFYKALSDGGKNPLFYVSSSDWNLFNMIRDFMEHRKIPHGPMLLKDLHVNLKNIFKSGGGSHQHKLEKVEMLMVLYPGMEFILIGDSGQHDPELYAQVMADYPGRVRAVYIREIKEIKEQRRKLLKAKLLDTKAPDIVFVKNTQQAMDHAINHSLIR